MTRRGPRSARPTVKSILALSSTTNVSPGPDSTSVARHSVALPSPSTLATSSWDGLTARYAPPSPDQRVCVGVPEVSISALRASRVSATR